MRYREHLYRQHMQKFACQQCRVKFEIQKQFDSHQNDEGSCAGSDAIVLPGITKEQEMQLRRRQRISQNCTEEDKWAAMYEILFPGEDFNLFSPTSKCKRRQSIRLLSIKNSRLSNFVETISPNEVSDSGSSFNVSNLKLLNAYEDFLSEQLQLKDLVLEAMRSEEHKGQPSDLSSLAVQIATLISHRREQVFDQFRRLYNLAPPGSSR
jgi:hypothetical protein